MLIFDFCFRYCQGLGIIAASLLLFMEEENAFWIMVTIVEDLLPASYYSSTLLGKPSYFTHFYHSQFTEGYPFTPSSSSEMGFHQGVHLIQV